MAKKKVILNKSELVEIISSTVATIQEQDIQTQYSGKICVKGGKSKNGKWVSINSEKDRNKLHKNVKVGTIVRPLDGSSNYATVSEIWEDSKGRAAAFKFKGQNHTHLFRLGQAGKILCFVTDGGTHDINSVGDLQKTMGNFGGFYNWNWGTKLFIGPSYSPSADQISDTHNKEVSKLTFTSEEMSTWDTSEQYYWIVLKLTPAEYINELIKVDPNLKGEEIYITLKSNPPAHTQGTSDLAVEVSKPPDFQYDKRSSYYDPADIYYKGGEFKGGKKKIQVNKDFKNARITLYFRINVDPAFWYNQGQNGKDTYNWPIGATARNDREEPEVIEEQIPAYISPEYSMHLQQQATLKKMNFLPKDNIRGHIPYKWTTSIEFNMGYISGEAEVVIDLDLKMGTMGFIVQKEFIKKSRYDADGTAPPEKSPMNPSNWSFNTKLDALAFVLFIIAGFFTEGAGWIVAARYISWGAYATVVGINAYDYIKQGKMEMAGIHLLFEVLMFAKPLKWFKGGVQWLKTSKGVTWATAKISTGLKYIRLGVGKTTVTAAKPTLELLMKNPGARRMIRILADGGEASLKTLKGNLKRAGSYKDITKEMAEEFIKVVTKANPEFIGKITVIQARKIIAEGSKRTSSRMLQTLIAIPEMVVSSIILITLYDINMIWFPFQTYLLGLDPKKYKPIEFTPLADLQAYLYEKMGKSDIDFKVPMYDVEGKEIVLQDLFGWWRVKDLITSTKMPNSAFHYDWKMTRAMYVAAIASAHVKAGSCPSIPKERHSLYTSNIYEPASEEEVKEWIAKQDQGTISADYKGVPIQAKKLIGRQDVNTKLKEDWINGWRPEHQCQVLELADIIKISEEDIKKDNVETMPPPNTSKNYYEDDDDWNRYVKEGAKKYMTLNNGEKLRLKVGDNTYFIVERPTPETLKWYNMLPSEIKSCFNSLMSTLEGYDPEDLGKYIDWVPPNDCIKLEGIEWDKWLNKSTITPK